MTTGTVEPSAPVAEAPAKNSFQRIAGVLFAPAETFRDIARKPDVLVPLIVLVIAYFVSVALVNPRLDYTAMNEMQAEAIKAKNPNMTEADIEQAQKIGNAFQKIGGWVSPLLWIIGYLIVAGVLLLGIRMLGGQGTFKQAFSVTLYAWIPIAIFRIVRGIVVMARGAVDPMELNTIVKSNPAFLVEFKEQPVAFALLGALDVFSIWSLILLILGFAAVGKVSRGKSAAVVIALWLVLVVIGAGFAVMGAAQMKG